MEGTGWKMFSTRVADLDFPMCIYNASGPRCTQGDELEILMDCDWSGAVVSKSCTLNSRVGNPLPRYYEKVGNSELMTINSTGLANLGCEFYLDYKFSNPWKPYVLSVAGLSMEENLEIFRGLEKRGEDCGVDLVELNLSCPNVVGKSQVGYDFEASEELLRKVSEIDLGGRGMGLKLPPYFDMVHFGQMADVVKEFSSKVRFVTCINSLGNGLVIDPDSESVVIKPKGGFGGIGGTVVKYVALANVRQFSKLLGDRMDVIGCGGVRTGTDVFEHILAGASAVQVGSLSMVEGVGCFKRLHEELGELMKSKGYGSIGEFKGRLKTIED